MKIIKVLISQGQGRLHFSEACESLEGLNLDFKMLIGWSPRESKLVDFIGLFFSKSKLSKRLSLRRPSKVKEERVISCTLPEVYYYFLIILSKFRLLSLDRAQSFGWSYWGKYSKQYIKELDIFHIRSGAGQGGAIACAKRKGVKVFTDHSIAHPMAMEQLLKKEYERFNLPFELDPRSEFWKMVILDCEQADVLLVNSKFVADTFIQYSYPKDKIRVVYLGVREDFFSLKCNWEITGKIKLLFTGSFSIRKGAIVILETLEILANEGIEVTLDVVGYYDELPSISKKYPIPTNITFHGNLLQDELKDFLVKSDVYIFPTLAEGSARSAMEAMAAGIPVITTDNCGSPIENNVTGIIIPINDPMALAEQVKKLAADVSVRASIGTKASRLIMENFTWKNYGLNLKHLYEQTI